MAEGGYENCFQISENFKYLLFTEHLVNYVILQNFSDYVGERLPKPSHPLAYILFNVTIKRAIYILGKELEGTRMASFNRMYQNREVSSFYYTIFDSGWEQCLFDRDFNGRVFLVYCAGISNLAACFYKCGIYDAPNSAKFHIFNILRNFMPAEGWNILNKAAEECIEIYLQRINHQRSSDQINS